ncbi:hypothetical protein [Rhizobium leguminosarum]|uniref:hypothetical protein n=1 Tax=Rhizobium leguminosarum TaxID=384 RepID=UPI002E164B40|nr:hypothetical protein U8Q02_36910 [Rhizobium leguminosarum]
MSYRELLAGDHQVLPILYPVSDEEVEALSGEVTFPGDLTELWLEIGCGSFASGKDGLKLTDFQNRLIGPDEIVELKSDDAFPDIDPFDVGTPFFETADLYFLVLTADGAVYHQGGTYISKNLPEFIAKVLDEPLFWLEMLPD